MVDDRSIEYTEHYVEEAVGSARAGGWSGAIWSGEHGSGLSWHLEAAMRTLMVAGQPLVVRVHTCGATVPESLERVDSVLERDNARNPDVVYVIDDIDDLDVAARDDLLSQLARRTPHATTIATAVDSVWVHGGTHSLKAVDIPKATPNDALSMLCAEFDYAASPMVIGELNRQLGGARGSVIEVMRSLPAHVRQGRRALHDPLTVTPSVRRHVAGWWTRLSPREREIAIAASVSIVDRVDVILSATSSVSDMLIAGPLMEHLDLAGGRFAFRDARARQCAHESATLAQRTLAHKRLGAALSRAGDARAAWHESLATFAGGAVHAPDVIALAGDALLRGNSSWAFAAAREAASQAEPEERPRALLVAGIAALNHGLLDDACDALIDVIGSGDENMSAAALAPYLVAESARTEGAEELALDQLMESVRAAGPPRARSERTALFVYGMLAGQRGDVDSAERAIRQAEQGCGEANASSTAWRRLGLLPDGRGPVCQWHAARDAISDLGAVLFGEAVRMLTERDSPIPTVPSEGQQTPLIRAFDTVAHGCELLARGRVADARRLLTDAAFEAPIGVPFAGAGVSALRRADVACTGVVGRTVASIEKSLGAVSDIEPDVAAVGAAVDDPERAVAALSRSDVPQRNWAPRLTLDTVGILLSIGAPSTEIALESDRCSHGSVAQLCARLRLNPIDALGEVISECVDAARVSSSLTERAQLQDAVADSYVRLGDEAAHDRHRACADELYELSGARTLSTHPIRVENRDAHAEWEQNLTPREREVAKLVVLGLSNAAAAQELGVSTRTIEVHLSRVFRKLSVRSRGELGYRVNTANPTAPLSAETANASRHRSMSTMVTW